MGYNYPWQSSSGVKGAQYFYQQLSVKTLWCDKTSPYWPQTKTLTGCIGTPIYGAARQKCNKNVDTNTCNTVALRNYTPAACKTDPAAKYCVAGTGGSPILPAPARCRNASPALATMIFSPPE